MPEKPCPSDVVRVEDAPIGTHGNKDRAVGCHGLDRLSAGSNSNTRLHGLAVPTTEARRLSQPRVWFVRMPASVRGTNANWLPSQSTIRPGALGPLYVDVFQRIPSGGEHQGGRHGEHSCGITGHSSPVAAHKSAPSPGSGVWRCKEFAAASSSDKSGGRAVSNGLQVRRTCVWVSQRDALPRSAAIRGFEIPHRSWLHRREAPLHKQLVLLLEFRT